MLNFKKPSKKLSDKSKKLEKWVIDKKSLTFPFVQKKWVRWKPVFIQIICMIKLCLWDIKNLFVLPQKQQLLTIYRNIFQINYNLIIIWISNVEMKVSHVFQHGHSIEIIYNFTSHSAYRIQNLNLFNLFSQTNISLCLTKVKHFFFVNVPPEMGLPFKNNLYLKMTYKIDLVNLLD